MRTAFSLFFSFGLSIVCVARKNAVESRSIGTDSHHDFDSGNVVIDAYATIFGADGGANGARVGKENGAKADAGAQARANGSSALDTASPPVQAPQAPRRSYRLIVKSELFGNLKLNSEIEAVIVNREENDKIADILGDIVNAYAGSYAREWRRKFDDDLSKM